MPLFYLAGLRHTNAKPEIMKRGIDTGFELMEGASGQELVALCQDALTAC